MAYLLDTHALIWFLEGSPDLSTSAKDIVSHSTNNIFVSLSSLWEISIKVSLGKLEMNLPFEGLMDVILKNNIELLDITFSHTVKQYQLPFYHRDPFDRILISQAIVENMEIISRDSIFDTYLKVELVKRIW